MGCFLQSAQNDLDHFLGHPSHVRLLRASAANDKDLTLLAHLKFLHKCMDSTASIKIK